MATSLIGPCLTESAFSAAPVPRPPQPIRATWMVFVSGGMDVRNCHAGQGRNGSELAGAGQEFTTSRETTSGFIHKEQILVGCYKRVNSRKRTQFNVVPPDRCVRVRASQFSSR